MACFCCRNWNEIYAPSFKDAGDVIKSVEQSVGNCTVTPTWQETTGLHFCALFAPKLPGEFAYCWRRMHENANEMARERAARIKAEKSAKELRAKLRALTARATATIPR
jgi:hypothetical protein